LWLGYKLTFKTKVIPPKHVDLVTGMRAIDDEEERFLAEQEALGPRSAIKKFWDSL
jgi:Amino acid transporters